MTLEARENWRNTMLIEQVIMTIYFNYAWTVRDEDNERDYDANLVTIEGDTSCKQKRVGENYVCWDVFGDHTSQHFARQFP